MKPYKRVTPIGVNTGKIIIGGHYIPKPKEMTSNEYFIQGLLLGRQIPIEVKVATITRQISSALKNTWTILRENTNEVRFKMGTAKS